LNAYLTDQEHAAHPPASTQQEPNPGMKPASAYPLWGMPTMPDRITRVIVDNVDAQLSSSDSHPSHSQAAQNYLI